MVGLSPLGVALTLFLTVLTSGQQANEHALDRQSTCGKRLTVYESSIILKARSNVAPANPPLECIVYLQSAYERADGRSRLQIIVEQLLIEDCSVNLAIFNGPSPSGNYLRLLGCSSSSTDIIYTKGREATLRFKRPLHLYQTTYTVILTVRAYADGDDLGTVVGVDKLSVGAIIGIVLGLLVVIALAILLGWCCCTGYINRFLGREGTGGQGGKVAGGLPPPNAPRITAIGSSAYPEGSIDSNLEKLSVVTSSTYQTKNGWRPEEPVIWASAGGGNQEGSQNFRRGVPRKAVGRGYVNPQAEHQPPLGSSANEGGARDSHLYEPYEAEGQGNNYSPRFRKRSEDPRASARSRGSRRSRNSGTGEGEGKETLIDDPPSYSSEDEIEKEFAMPVENSAPLHREGSQVEVDTIASPLHINAGVRASIPDLTQPSSSPPPSPKSSPRKKKPSPSQRGREPDPMGLPPEAFDPVFTTPTSQEQYPGEWRPLQQPQQPPFAVPFMPYGMVPLVPGQQTYAYAYQTAPHMGAYPGQQGAYFMQSVPTAEGDVQKTAFAMHSERTPKGKSGAHPGSPEFSSTPEGKSRVPPSSLNVAKPAPSDPHRSVAMKSFADPDSGIQTTQVMWTDNVPDPTDPKPGDSSQVTRQTTTRVTTRSGHGEMPQHVALLDEPDPNPAFLAPSAPRPAALPPAAHTPSAPNVQYYTGQRSAPVAVDPPRVIHEAPSRSRAFRDTVTLADSSEV